MTSLQLPSLEALYAADASAPERIVRETHRRATESPASIWIHLPPLERLLSDLAAAE